MDHGRNSVCRSSGRRRCRYLDQHPRAATYPFPVGGRCSDYPNRVAACSDSADSLDGETLAELGSQSRHKSPQRRLARLSEDRLDVVLHRVRSPG
jgi:hypothetical protein